MTGQPAEYCDLVMKGGITSGLVYPNAVLALAKGERVTAADVHNAWAAWMQEENRGHPAIRPFEELDSSAQRADEPFVKAIKTVVALRSR